MQQELQRKLCSNHKAPEIYPLPDRSIIPGVPEIQIPAIMTEYSENLLRAIFNPGNQGGQKILLEKTRALSEEKHLDLTASNASNIIEYLDLEKAHIGEIISAIPTF